MKKIMVISPHPDDETLGCGGTLFRHRFEGDEVYWLNMTDVHEDDRFDLAFQNKRENELTQITALYRFHETFHLKFRSLRLQEAPLELLVGRIKEIFKKINPEIIYFPHQGDLHSDHRVVFDAVTAAAKWFRQKSIRRMLTYETVSETDDSGMRQTPFLPSVYVDISNFLEKKIEAMCVYASEMGEFPFPRSPQALRALAHYRGSQAGVQAAEAFMLLKEIL